MKPGRLRSVSRSALLADRVARVAITGGGAGLIVAVMGVLAFLVWEVVPLLLPARIAADGVAVELPVAAGPRSIRALGVDDRFELAWAMLGSGEVVAFGLQDGAELSRHATGLADVSAVASSLESDLIAAGDSGGRLHLLRVSTRIEFPDPEAVPRATLEALDSAGVVRFGEDRLAVRTPEGQLRVSGLAVEVLREMELPAAPVHEIAVVQGASGPRIATLAGDGEDRAVFLVTLREKASMLTGKVKLTASAPQRIELQGELEGEIRELAMLEAGRSLVVASATGKYVRVDLTDVAAPVVVERGELEGASGGLTAMTTLLGGETLLWSGAGGELAGGFLIPRHALDDDALAQADWPAAASEQPVLVRTRRLQGSDAAVTVMAPTIQERLLVVGRADGALEVFTVTAQKLLARARVEGGAPIERIAVAPREDGLLVLSGGRLHVLHMEVGYPDATIRTLFLPTWYEGYPRPEHVYQSSSGHTGAEPKLGLVPLIFGTLKATFYSLLFAVPIALMAALASTEIVHARTRGRIKPVVELMASLPSVVLGFLAAIVLAPVIEDHLSTCLALLFTTPLAFLAGSAVWMALPAGVALRLDRLRLWFSLVPLAAGVLLAAPAGALAESVVYAGDLRGWLSMPARGAHLDAEERWLPLVFTWGLMFSPLAAVLVSWLAARTLRPLAGARAAQAWRSALRVGAGVLATVVVCALVGLFATTLGLDPRESFLGTYVQRNAAVVGLVMGFAIVPLIYTIADDALAAVPDHLRAASLGAGATRWQTAVRIVLPMASSGIFAALMVGLGRAVGETMIVLMAAGNTPVLSFSAFDGFRTLSANLAVELPEAVRGSTHYRVLFLAALILFAMTFVTNTLAELLRISVRRRVRQL